MVAGHAPFASSDGSGRQCLVFFQGCGFDCLTCRSPSTIPAEPQGMRPVSVAEVMSRLVPVAGSLTGVTITGGEPTVQPAFLEALLSALGEHPETAHLRRFVESNGDAPAEVWDRLLPLVDGVMVDLKALDEAIHLVLTGSDNRRTLAAIARLSACGALREVRLLLVPGLNDDPETLTRTARWLCSLDARVPVRVHAYRRHGTRPCARFLLEVTAADRVRYRRQLTAAGLDNLVVD
jgi:pyruvate formate lyase activating enzyme